MDYLCCTRRTIDIGLVIESLELFQALTRPLSQSHNNCLASIVPQLQSSQCPLLWSLEQVEDSIVVNFVIAHSNLNLGLALRVFLNFPAPPIYAAE